MIKYAWWPINIKWAKVRKDHFIDHHSWRIGFLETTNGIIELRGRTLHIGNLKILFGHK